MPGIPQPTAESAFTLVRGHARNPSYSLFPNDQISPRTIVPQSIPQPYAESIYDISDLEPPPAIFGGGGRHRRDSSIASSATVQIGLRLSNGMAAFQPEPLPSFPPSTYAQKQIPLQILPKPEPVVHSPRRPSPLVTNISPLSPIRSPSVNKTLPPTPKPATSSPEKSVLSPAVYSPERKATSPQRNPLRNNPLVGVGQASATVTPAKRPPRQSKLDWI